MSATRQSCPLVRKLENFVHLSAEERAALTSATSRSILRFDTRSVIRAEGTRAESALLIHGGWACRHKYLEDGRRQIISLLLPGDLTDRGASVFSRSDHSIAALTKTSAAEIAQDDMLELEALSRRVAMALNWSDLLEFSIQREWTLNLGCRDATERIGHLLCEIFIRLRSVGLVEENRCAMPLTQQELGEIAGISAVHVNRVMQELRATRLIAIENRTLVMRDLDALMSLCQFDPGYLHLAHEGAHLGANL